MANKAKGDFLMNMSHELRTPLGGVLTATELLSTCKTKEEQNKIQQIISSSSNSLLKTIEQILNFTQSKDGFLELESSSFRLDELLSSVSTKFFHKGSQVKIDLTFKIDPGKVTNFLAGDQARIIEILNHLLENSAKFTKKSPRASLSIITVEKTPDNVLLEFSLTDNGIGIDPEHSETVFDPFSQADTSSTRSYDGVGIGLSVCRQLVELMGGKIWFSSVPDNGTTFFFTLRLKRQDTDEPLNIELLQTKNVEEKIVLSPQSNEDLLEADIANLAPIILSLSKALTESDPQDIHNYLSEISSYNIPLRAELLQKVDDYEYDGAETILKKIAAQLVSQV